MIEIFLETTPERMDQVRCGVRDGDPKTAEIGAHTLKSSAANLGAVHLRRVAEEAEDLASSNNLEALRARVPVLEATLGAAQEALRHLLDGMQP
jgi:HPt (histidine-containing phosphotransfer) domain-containing protein